jgi:hypothetical protein
MACLRGQDTFHTRSQMSGLCVSERFNSIDSKCHHEVVFEEHILNLSSCICHLPVVTQDYREDEKASRFLFNVTSPLQTTVLILCSKEIVLEGHTVAVKVTGLPLGILEAGC